MKKKRIVLLLLMGMIFIISGCAIGTSELVTDSETLIIETSEEILQVASEETSQETLQEEPTSVEASSEELPVLNVDETENLYFDGEILTDYVAPSSVGEDLYKFNVSFEGNMYSLPCPVSELLENGFVMENEPEYIESGKFCTIKFKYGNQSFDANVVNYADVATIPENCFICELTTVSDDGSIFDMTIPCNIKVGDTQESLMSKLEGFYYEYAEEGSKWLYVNENSFVYSFGILINDGNIEAISVSNPIIKDMYTGKVELTDIKAINSYFYNEIGEHIYSAKFAECENVNEAKVSVKEIANFDTGALYKLEIICDKQVQDIYGDMLDLGYFYVEKDYIYKIDENLSVTTQTSIDELIRNGTLVCQDIALKDPLGENERGWHEYIVVNDDSIEYHGYSNAGSTNFYEDFTWEPEKGLVYYKSGFGAESYGIELTLID